MIASYRASLSTRSNSLHGLNPWIVGGHREQWPCQACDRRFFMERGRDWENFSSKTAPPSEDLDHYRSNVGATVRPITDALADQRRGNDAGRRGSRPELQGLTRAFAKVALRGDGAGSSGVPEHLLRGGRT